MEMAAPYVEGLEACKYTEDSYGDDCRVFAVRNGEHLEADCDTMLGDFGIPEPFYYADSSDCMNMIAPFVEGLESCMYFEDYYDDDCWVQAWINGEYVEADCD
jgi:hypothetical protein